MPPADSYQRHSVPDDYYRAFMKCWRDASGDVIVRFHKTNVVTVRPNGDVVLFTNKYYTYTTVCSINDALQFIDMKVSVRGEFKDPGNWLVTVVGSAPVSFSDNMLLKARFPDDRLRGQEVLQGLVPLLNGATPPQHAATRLPAAAAPPPAAPAPAATTVTGSAGTAAPAQKGSAWAGGGGTSLAARLAVEAEQAAAAMAAAAAKAGTNSAAPARDPVVPGAVWVEAKPAAKKKSAAPKAMPAAAAVQPAAAAARTAGSSSAGSTANSAAAHAAAAAAHHAPSSSSSSSALGAFGSSNGGGGGGGSFAGAGLASGGGGGGFVSGPVSGNDGEVVAALMAGTPLPAPSSAITEVFLRQASEWGEGEVDEGKLCVVCMHHKREVMIIPCGHIILCRTCADTVLPLTPGTTSECPLCRAPAEIKLDVA